jgi:hypothetical protein
MGATAAVATRRSFVLVYRSWYGGQWRSATCLALWNNHGRHERGLSTLDENTPEQRRSMLPSLEANDDAVTTYKPLVIPQRRRSKVVNLHDAVSLVSNGDTVSCSGFVAQGTFGKQSMLQVPV